MKKSLVTIAILGCLAYLTGCSESHADAPAQQVQAFKQPIDVAAVKEYPVQTWFTYTSRLEAMEFVQLKPRVSGNIAQVNFEEGQQINKGDVLFTLDERPFMVKVAELKAQLASAKAQLSQAKNDLKRADRLLASKSISQEEVEHRRSLLAQHKANVQATKAKLDAAELDLAYSKVKAPINGVVSRAELTKGNTVQAGVSLLTHLVSDDYVYAYFDINERTWHQQFNQLKGDKTTQVVMQMLGEQGFNHGGVIDFVDNRIDIETGTLRVRALFRATDQLKPGAFARIRVAADDVKQHVLVPEKAIGTDLKNRFVLVTDEQNVLQYRPVTLGDRYGQMRAITQGLQAGDKIAVNGPARVGPGMPVAPQLVEIEPEHASLVMTKQAVKALLVAKRGE
ncbi:Efflux pump periplasmic linker BepF [Pseudoalteromonas holothuriae]|uniref:Efflux pump periplasmic linker BepF n=1 Tax=Pseudoalteromonas holothuriae TaxID=2963714 RepID=A0A9W4QT74_9GAMM|nr:MULTISPECIES: efflux RND transporter periplasmic adaptor subunit [unclassified Pseudoalteromonas]CAH9051855.1 Efflux pump periplasmic linker BepF [Pseudoalteromonas sp. CIP111854]CAH9057399.1 Efflux pump periplasmic linker BepF [Pseudoalteromonas sp. CIP111951]